MENSNLREYRANSGRFIPAWTLEIQTVIEDVDKILDAVAKVHPLCYGRYRRNASISAMGMETAQPDEDSTTAMHVQGYTAGTIETYPMVELKLSIERDNSVLELVMDAIHYVHHYEEPVIFLREDWISRAHYKPDNDNPNRFWNNGRGLPNRIDSIYRDPKP